MLDNENESLLEFPCQFPIKALGNSRCDVKSVVVDILQRHVSEWEKATIKQRPSKNGKYVSVTVSFEAASRAQLDAIYQDLTASEFILMAL